MLERGRGRGTREGQGKGCKRGAGSGEGVQERGGGRDAHHVLAGRHITPVMLLQWPHPRPSTLHIYTVALRTIVLVDGDEGTAGEEPESGALVTVLRSFYFGDDSEVFWCR